MGLETVNNGTNAAKISELVDTNPLASDSVNKGDDHIRNIKKVIKDTFSGINAEGDDAVTVTAESAELKNETNKNIFAILKESVLLPSNYTDIVFRLKN